MKLFCSLALRVSLVLIALGCASVGGNTMAQTRTTAEFPTPRISHAIEILRTNLETAGYAVSPLAIQMSEVANGSSDERLFITATRNGSPTRIEIDINAVADAHGGEGYKISTSAAGEGSMPSIRVTGSGQSGVLYGCLELTDRIKSSGQIPAALNIEESPAFKLRGAAIGMQLMSKLPGREIYEYPYTPEIFPWFYDKETWIEYLDVLAENRYNTLYLWNGHPFASLVKLDDYPYALEVTEEEYQRNVEMFGFLTAEADKRGIWVIQMFYNIFVSEPFAEHHNIGTQHSRSTPLIADYNRKSIAKFVEQYPNVGLLVCLGEALRGQEHQEFWMKEVVIPGVRDGMAALGITEEPPIVVRAHSVSNVNQMVESALQHYSNLYTMAKYNGESLTTYEPRGQWHQIHNDMSHLGSAHVVNIHLLSNLEPFRYGAQEFIRKSTLAMHDELGAQGIHLYPLAYWDWPNSPDKTNPLLKQYKRDWLWFDAWGRYTWNPDRDLATDREYWIGKLADTFGSREAATHILDAYNHAGECAPQLLRRFGITEGNRQTLSLGMTLDQLVNPGAYGEYSGLWESHAPPGERINTYVERELAGQPHEGETPISVIELAVENSAKALAAIDAAAPHVTRNREEFDRLVNDMHCIRQMSLNYNSKVRAAIHVKRYEANNDLAEMKAAAADLAESLAAFRRLTDLTRDTYRYANTLQIGHRRIPYRGEYEGQPAYYHWTQVLPNYEKELANFQRRVHNLEIVAAGGTLPAEDRVLPAETYDQRNQNGETLYDLAIGARPFSDRDAAFTALAPELTALKGVRHAFDAFLPAGENHISFEASQPVKVLIGYFNDPGAQYAKPPNPDIDSRSSDQGGVESTLHNAVAIAGMPPVNVHVFEFGPGPRRFDPRGPGVYLFLGVVPGETDIERRDVGLTPQ